MTTPTPLQSLIELRQFYQVAMASSFSGAAKILNQTSAAVSAGIKRLESHLKVRLFERSTRTVSLTEEGKQLFIHCQNIFSELDLVTENLQRSKTDLSGNLTIAAPGDLARTSLNAWIKEFIQLYPDITFDIRVSDSITDLQKSSINLAIRFGIPANSNLIARPIVELPQIACASPSYLKKHGEPVHPHELAKHNCLCYRAKDRRKDAWTFFKGEDTYNINISGTLSTDDSSLARQWAIEGLGIVYKSLLDVKEDINQGHLVPLLKDYQGQPAPLYAVYPGKENLPMRTQTFINFIISKNKFLKTPNPK